MGFYEDEYGKALPFITACSEEVGKLLANTLRSLGDPYLVRVKVESPRPKSLPSIQRKAAEKGWTLSEAFEKAVDLVGYRVACNNLQDVDRAAEVLTATLKKKGLSVTKRDFIRKGTKTGYRAIHLRIPVKVTIAGVARVVGCEIQIRSLLQHAWAELSRIDIYTKEEDLDPSLLRSMERLSQLLHVADQVANDIREEIARPRKGEPPAEGAPLTGPTIAFLYERAFKELAPDYVVQSTLREFAGTPVRADGLDAVLKDDKFLKRLTTRYEDNFGWKPGTEQIFRWVVHAAAHGIDSAMGLVDKEALADREEVDAAFLTEIRAELPETWEEVVEMLEDHGKDADPEHDIMRWANAFDALGECGICGTGVVRTDSLAEALVDHYELEGDEADNASEAIESALLNSGVETGDLFDSSLCCYHGDVMRRND